MTRKLPFVFMDTIYTLQSDGDAMVVRNREAGVCYRTDSDNSDCDTAFIAVCETLIKSNKDYFFPPETVSKVFVLAVDGGDTMQFADPGFNEAQLVAMNGIAKKLGKKIYEETQAAGRSLWEFSDILNSFLLEVKSQLDIDLKPVETSSVVRIQFRND